jgi:hypothetical protein
MKQELEKEILDNFKWRIHEVKAICRINDECAEDIASCVNSDFKLLIKETQSKIISIIDKRIETLKDTSKTEGLELSQISELNAINGVIQVLESLKKEVKE